MKIIEIKNHQIGRRKSVSVVDKSTTKSCVIHIKALQEARIIAEEYQRLGGGKVDVQELARQISADY